MGETIGQFFKQFGLTVAFALAFSTISAYTLTPMVSAHWLKAPGTEKDKDYRPRFVDAALKSFNAGFDYVRGLYDQLMVFAVRHPKKIILGSLVTLVFNLFLLPFVGTELQPIYDSGEFRVNVKAAPGIGLNQMAEWTWPLEQVLMEMKDEVRVENMHLGGVRTAVNEGAIEVKLKPAEERKRGMLDIMADLRGKFRNVGDMQVAVVTNQGSRGDPRPVQIGLRGSDLVRLTKYANDLAEKIRQVPGSADVEVIGIDPEPEIMIRLDQSKASQLGALATPIRLATMTTISSSRWTNKTAAPFRMWRT